MKTSVLLLLYLVIFTASFAQPANDECTGAIPLTVTTDNFCTSAYTANITGATQSLSPCISTTYPAMDVWYKFTATATTHSILLTPTSYTDFIIQVYSGSSCSSFTSIACINNTDLAEFEGGTLTNLVSGNTYYIRIYNKFGWPNIQFKLCISTNTAPIPNDEATGAVLRPTGSSEYTHFSNLGATLSLPACTLSADNDIWFKFVATSTRHIVRYSSAGTYDYPTAVQVFSGTPGSLTSIRCYGGSDNAADINGLIPGATYYYRIYVSSGNAVKTDFTTYILTPVAGPVNDECTGAISLPVNADNYCNNAYTANVTGATQSLPACIATGYSALDVWYKFVATGTTHSITLTPTSFTDFLIQVYSGSCSSLSSIACIDNTSISEIEGGTLTNLTPGNTYYVRIYNRYAWPDLQFQLCINSNNRPVPNDEAAGAITRPTIGTDYTRFTNLGATLSLPACTLSADNDIWFKFVATSSRHIIRYNSAGNSTYPLASQIFSGTPGNLTSIRCYGGSDNAVDISGLTPGTTYYYRIYISSGSSAKTDFTTYISTPVSGPVNDECSGAIAISCAPIVGQKIKEIKL